MAGNATLLSWEANCSILAGFLNMLSSPSCFRSGILYLYGIQRDTVHAAEKGALWQSEEAVGNGNVPV